MTWKELEERVHGLDIFHKIGSREPMLSKPVLFSMDDNWYVVYMLYHFYYEDVPDGFCIVDLKTNNVTYMDEADGRLFLAIPDEVYLEPADEDYIPDIVEEEELEGLFNEVLKDGTPNRAIYTHYLFRVMDGAKAKGRNFYGYFG